MLSKNDIKKADMAANSAFSDEPYHVDYAGDILFYADGSIYAYDDKYFDSEDAFDFLIMLGAVTLPRSYYGKKTIDYMGRSIDIGEETYFYQGYAFYSDESLDFICFLGAKEVVL